MFVEELIHGSYFAACDVGTVVPVLIAHERVGMFIKLLPYFGMVCQKML